MAAKPMSKSKIVATLAEKCGTPKKTASLFFEELFKLAVGMQGWRGQIRDSEHRPRGEGAPQGAHGPQSANRRGHQDQGQDGGPAARIEGVQGRGPEVVFRGASEILGAAESSFAPPAGLWVQALRGIFFCGARTQLELAAETHARDSRYVKSRRVVEARHGGAHDAHEFRTLLAVPGGADGRLGRWVRSSVALSRQVAVKDQWAGKGGHHRERV